MKKLKSRFSYLLILLFVLNGCTKNLKTSTESTDPFEGLNRNMATHAAGVVIAGEKLSEQFPLYVDHASNLILPSTQYDMYSSENAGLVKFDLLGLKTLTVIDKTLKRLKVKILVGKNKKKEGEVIEIDRSKNRAKVKEINMVKKHVKTTKEKKGGIISKESFIHLSNLKLITEKNKNKKTEAKK